MPQTQAQAQTQTHIQSLGRSQRSPSPSCNSKRRPRGSRAQRKGDAICWTTALVVCIATLQGIDNAEAFVVPTSANPTANPTANPLPTTSLALSQINHDHTAWRHRRRHTNRHSSSSSSSSSSSCRSPTVLGAARREDDPWSLSSSTTRERQRQRTRQRTAAKNENENENGVKTKTKPKTKTKKKESKPRMTQSQSVADAYYQLLDHELLTKAEELELGFKIRKFIDTKAKIEEMIETKNKEYEKRQLENQKRREKAAEDRRKQRMRSQQQQKQQQQQQQHSDFYGEIFDNDDDDLSLEEELEEYLVNKGLVPGNSAKPPPPRRRSSIEDLYGGFDEDDDDDNEQAMMEELGMAVYGIETYDDDDDDGISDGLTVLESKHNGYDYPHGSSKSKNNDDCDDDDDDYDDLHDELADDFSDDLYEHSAASQLGDTMDRIRMLTEKDIVDQLGIAGGRNELAHILVDGALAKQRMIRSNVRLVTSIAQKWMRTSAASVHAGANRNADHEKKPVGSHGMGDWSTPSLDEVIQQGIVGLAIAAERFEPERNFKFSTYATYYITNEVRQIMQSATTQCLYVPPYFYTIKNKYEKIIRDHYRETGGDPNKALELEEIATRLKLKTTRLEFILRSTQSLAQLDARLDRSNASAGKAGGGPDSDNAETLADILPATDPSPEEIVERSLLRQCLENALAAELLPLERDIVRLRHGLDDGKSRTHKEVMGSFGGMLTLNDIRTAETRAYRKLRYKSSVHNARLREFAAEFIGVAPEKLKA